MAQKKAPAKGSGSKSSGKSSGGAAKGRGKTGLTKRGRKRIEPWPPKDSTADVKKDSLVWKLVIGPTGRRSMKRR